MNKSFLLTPLLPLLTACTSDEQPLTSRPETPVAELSAPMTMHLQVIGFDDSQTRASTAHQWTDGAMLYLHFYNGQKHFRGTATYSADDDSWTCTRAGELAAADRCEAYYFEGASTDNVRSVSLTPANAVYADQQATYTYEEGTVELLATLHPLTARLRLKGTPGLGASLSGVLHYTGYNADTNTLGTATTAVSAQVAADGFTGYQHLLFADTDTRRLSLTNSADGSNVNFSLSFPEGVLSPGTTGYITIPTLATNRGWEVNY
ncbi:MAG: hypothetical protein K5928_01265 [Prevotella sp.]|nr:hypothetical protein [Prevotella sp.]